MVEGEKYYEREKIDQGIKIRSAQDITFNFKLGCQG